MIYSFYEQLIMIIYFILYGIFLIISYDILNYYLAKIKSKYLYHAIEVAFWVSMIFISLIFMQRISKGYIPLYTFLFFIVGIIIYITFIQESFIQDLTRFDLIISKILVKIIKVLWYIIFPIEVLKKTSQIFKKLVKKFVRSIKKIFKKRAKLTEEI